MPLHLKRCAGSRISSGWRSRTPTGHQILIQPRFARCDGIRCDCSQISNGDTITQPRKKRWTASPVGFFAVVNLICFMDGRATRLRRCERPESSAFLPYSKYRRGTGTRETSCQQKRTTKSRWSAHRSRKGGFGDVAEGSRTPGYPRNARPFGP